MTSTTTEELCAQPGVLESLERYCDDSAETVLVAAQGLDVAPDRLAYLDNLKDSDRDVSGNLARILGVLPPETVFRTYGEHVLAWAALNASPSVVRKRLSYMLGELAGYDEVLFEKARLWCWQRCSCCTKTDEILAQHNIMEALHGSALEQVDLPTLLEDSTRPNVVLSKKRIADYSLAPLRAEESFSFPEGREVNWSQDIGPLRYNIWLDAPTGFALMYRGAPQAVAAVAATPFHKNELMIHQLQGVRPYILNPDKSAPGYGPDSITGRRSARGLAPLDWQAFLVNTAEAVAARLGMDSLAIQEGKQNYWIKPHDGKPAHLKEEEAVRAYDEPAARLGFVRGEDGNWHRPIAAV